MTSARLGSGEADLYTVGTRHIQDMIAEAGRLAALCHGQGQEIDLMPGPGKLRDGWERCAEFGSHPVGEHDLWVSAGNPRVPSELGGLPTVDVLERAADRLAHAAAELREERASLNGWRQ